MRIALRDRILLNFVVLIAGFAVVGALGGTYFINKNTVAEEQRRVSVDLRSAWSVINSQFNELSILANVLGTGRRVAAVYEEDLERETVRASLEAVRMEFGLDFLTLTDAHGRVVMRTLAPYQTGDDLSNDPFISNALQGHVKGGFYLLTADRLASEGGDLVERAFTAFTPTPKAKPRAKTSETSGLAMVAAAPVRDRTGHIYGVICAGSLLNRNHSLVDHIRSLVFEGEVLEGKPVGTVTIFQWDVRIATNVILPNGNRAFGTRVSSAVYDRVLENNSSFYDRAFVVNDWYISAYDPIKDVEDKVIGILYVGVLAKKYDEIRMNLWKIYGALSLVSALLTVAVALLFARRLTNTVGRLAEASGRIAEGELDLRVPEPRADDELHDLTKAFNSMAGSLRDKEERLRLALQELEKTNASLHKVNRNYLEMLGFVSHELKNTLGVIFTSAKALNEGLVGPLSEDQAGLISGITKNISTAVNMTRKYLDLTRIEKGELNIQLQYIDFIVDVVNPVIDELSQALASRRMTLSSDLPGSLFLNGDPTLLRVVVKNLLDNAIKYGSPHGGIRLGFREGPVDYIFDVWNEGSGLTADKLDKIFDKFVRFKSDGDDEGKGTGLGLFVTRDIVEKHGGTITAESEPGRWIDFIFTLPKP